MNAIDQALRPPDTRLLRGKPAAIMAASNMLVLNKPEVLNRESAAEFDAEGRLETA